ncbi:MAG: hypothetical protein MR006_03790 [Arcanobacterium sp.]|nr:hypothetical protein [Arcanobacterium sp.]MDY5588842.1 hypothetical protein [Arcanobacterium sp.]
MNKILSVYLNCSLGGMTSVYRARALHHLDHQYDYVFSIDSGGRSAYSQLPNVSTRIIGQEALVNYLNYLVRFGGYSEVRVTANPSLYQYIEVPSQTKKIYEIHSPDINIIVQELSQLDVTRIDEIWVPSYWSKRVVELSLSQSKKISVCVHQNEIDYENFSPESSKVLYPQFIAPARGSAIPISWIGRLENTQKNYLDFFRTLSLLPDNYYGILVYSYTSDPLRLSNFLGDAAGFGVSDRLELLSDIPQQQMGCFHRQVRDAGGVFYSTSLSESFGYGVIEADLCACPVVSFDVGALSEHTLHHTEFVNAGDVYSAARAIRKLTELKSSAM